MTTMEVIIPILLVTGLVGLLLLDAFTKRDRCPSCRKRGRTLLERIDPYGGIGLSDGTFPSSANAVKWKCKHYGYTWTDWVR